VDHALDQTGPSCISAAKAGLICAVGEFPGHILRCCKAGSLCSLYMIAVLMTALHRLCMYDTGLSSVCQTYRIMFLSVLGATSIRRHIFACICSGCPFLMHQFCNNCTFTVDILIWTGCCYAGLSCYTCVTAASFKWLLTTSHSQCCFVFVIIEGLQHDGWSYVANFRG